MNVASAFSSPRPAPAPPVLTRHGLGYRRRFDDIEFVINRLRESGGDVRGQLRVVHRRPNGSAATLFRGSFNLSGDRSRETLASSLRRLLPAKEGTWWSVTVSTFATEVLDAEDTELQLELVGRGPLDPEPNCLFGGAFMPRDEITTLYARGGEGKSTLGAALAVSMETGTEVVPGWRPLHSGSVLIIDAEGRSRTWHRRIQQIAEGVGLVEPPAVRYMRLRGRFADHLEQIASVVTENQIQLLIIDSAEAAAGVGDSDGYSDRVARLFSAIGRLGVTCLLIDHVSGESAKTEQGGDRPFGSVFKVNWSRQTWRLQREKEPQNGRAEVVLSNSKINDGPKHPAVGLVITYRADSIVFSRADVRAPELATAFSSAERMARLLTSEGAQPEARIAEVLGISENTVRGNLKRYPERFVRLPNKAIGVAHRD